MKHFQIFILWNKTGKNSNLEKKIKNEQVSLFLDYFSTLKQKKHRVFKPVKCSIFNAFSNFLLKTTHIDFH